MKFSIKHSFSKWEQIRSFLRITSYLLNNFLHNDTGNIAYCHISLKLTGSIKEAEMLNQNDQCQHCTENEVFH